MSDAYGGRVSVYLSLATGPLPNGDEGVIVSIRELATNKVMAAAMTYEDAEMFSENLAKVIYEGVKIPQEIKM